MLSRIAESLYWVGRYVERAEDTARILDVHVHRRLEDPAVEEDAACRGLLGIMGITPPEALLDTAAMIDILAFRPADPTSIAGALTCARENARSAREAMSSEMWECLNATYNVLQFGTLPGASGLGPHAFFAYVKERAAILAGLADSTMSRDDAWRFLVLGRSLERVDMTARLLSATLHDAAGPAEWVTTLRCCSAHEAFLRTYQRAVEPDLVAEFLLLDRLFPRSAFHALGEAEECLAELQPGSGRAGVDDEARRILGRARTDLEFRR
ncbi:MAG: alpha-E domain-containing protein, partial [Actinomycetota bacterium]|nr:alpha-E domain-containing protein [Actinomycetota bacterium]